MKNIFFITLSFVGLAISSYAQQATPTPNQPANFTVQDCINYAYEHQDSVINAKLDVRSAEYNVKETIGRGLPQVSGTAGFQDYLKIPTTLLPGEIFGQPAGTFIPVKFGVKYQSNLGVNASQIIFDPDYLVGLQARTTYKQLYERSYTRSKIETNVNVTKAYYQVLVSNEKIRLLDANLKQLKQQLDETTAQNKQGMAEKIDVDRLVVQYNNLVTERENTLRLLALNYQLLKFQMGMPIENELLLKDKLDDIKLDDNVADVGADTTFYKSRIEYNLLETQKTLNEYDVKRKKGQFLPKLTANANYTSSYQNNGFSNLYSMSFPSSYIGLTLNVPIFTGFQHSYQLKQSQINVQKAENNLISLKNSLNLQASKAKITYVNGIQSLNSQKQNQQLAQEVLRVSKIKYQQGVGSSIEVTQAQTSLDDADNKYIQGLYDALVSKVDLDKAYGRIK
ncbi:MAG TPA: TolC family protein [Mucilaginibacter sp.]|nr:TolC family protein [Mucilaginibacter sp.]